MPDHVSHFEIGVRNMDSAREFYSRLFGWDFTVYKDDYLVSGIGDAPEGLGLNLISDDQKPYVTCYIEVPSIEDTLVKVQNSGGTVLKQRTIIDDVYGWFAWISDPDGNLVGLWERNRQTKS